MAFKHFAKRVPGLPLAALIFALVVAVHYRELLLNLHTSKCLEPYRDGIKTYLNAAWHTRYGHSTTWFAGMNYPYEEHIMAATEFPGVAILLKWLEPIFPNLPDHAFGVIHLLLLISVWLCPVFLYLIFRQLKLPDWYSIPVALGLTFLAPQNMRMMPHMGLGPLFVIPAVIYGLLLFEKGRRWQATALLFAVIVLSSFFHFYFFAITVFTVSGFLFFYLFQSFSWQRLRQIALHLAVTVGLPFLFFYFWMIASDQVTDRSPQPWGFFVFKSIWESIFTSLEMPLFRWINEHVIKIETTDFEGWAYVGLVAGAFVVTAFFRWLGRLFRKPLLDFLPADDRQFYYPLLWTGVAIALISCGQPFAIKGLEFLLDYTGPFQQFRSVGRFAWVFYFAINVLAFSGFYYLLTRWQRKTAGKILLGCLLAVLIYEAYFFSKSRFNYASHQLRQVETLVPGQRFTDLPGIDFSRYQAIVPIPYYNVGSNNFGAAGGAYTIQQSLILSYQTGLPVTGAMLTRSSRRQAYDQMQLVSEPYRKPRVFEDYENEKPLLLILTNPFSHQDSVNFLHLTEESRLLHQTEQWSLYEMEMASFERRIENRKSAIRQALAPDALYSTGAFRSTDSLENFVFFDFDSLPAGRVYRGDGALQSNSMKEIEWFSSPLPAAKAGVPYHLLNWVYVDEELLGMIYIRIREEDEAGQKVGERQFLVFNQIVVYDPNGWALIECPFQLQSEKNKVSIAFYGLERKERPYFFDEALIKPVDTHLFRQGDDFIWKDCRFFEK